MSWVSTDPSAPIENPPPGEVSDFEHPIDYGLMTLIITTLVVCMSLSTACVLARIYARAFVVRLFGWDDGLAVLGMGMNIGLAVSIVGLTNTGFAIVPWNITLGDFMKTYMHGWIYWNSVFTIFLYFAFGIIKLSILAFYLRLLGSAQKKTRIGVWVVIVFVLAVLIGTTATLLSFCDPPGKLFDMDANGTCNYWPELFTAQAVLQIASDVFILIPPIPIIWRLNLSMTRKLGVIGLLSIGLFVTSIGIARLVILIQDQGAQNAAVNNHYLGQYLCIFEINASLIACCLPALTQLLGRFRQWQQTRKSRSSYNKSAMSGPSDGSTPAGHSTGKSSKSGGSKGSKNPNGTSVTEIMNDSDVELAGTASWSQAGDGDRSKESIDTASEDGITRVVIAPTPAANPLAGHGPLTSNHPSLYPGWAVSRDWDRLPEHQEHAK